MNTNQNKFSVANLEKVERSLETQKIGKIFKFYTGTIKSESGNIPSLSGSIKLFGPYNSPTLENFEKVEKLLQDLVQQERVPWDEEEIYGESSHIKTSIYSAAYFNPSIQLDEPVMIGMSLFFLCVIYIDDILDKTDGFGGLNVAGNFSDRFLDVALNIFKGDFQSLNEIPQLIPSLNPILRLAFKSYEYAIQGIGESFAESSSYFRKSLGMDITAGLLMKQVSKFSDWTFLKLRSRDGGFHSVFSMIVLIRDIQIPKQLRQNYLFQSTLENAATVLSLTNDMFGLRKEIENKEKDNFVLREMETKNVKLEVAWNKVNEMVHDLRKDIEVACELLINQYSDPESEDEGIPPIVQIMNILTTLLDGHIYFSIHGKRYGEIKYEEFEEKEEEAESVSTSRS